MGLDKKQRSTVLQFTKQHDPLEGMVKVEGMYVSCCVCCLTNVKISEVKIVGSLQFH